MNSARAVKAICRSSGPTPTRPAPCSAGRLPEHSTTYAATPGTGRGTIPKAMPRNACALFMAPMFQGIGAFFLFNVSEGREQYARHAPRQTSDSSAGTRLPSRLSSSVPLLRTRLLVPVFSPTMFPASCRLPFPTRSPPISRLSLFTRVRPASFSRSAFSAAF